MRKLNTSNLIILSAIIITLATFFSFYAYGETKILCANATSCTKAAPRETQMLWDAVSNSFSSISTR